jgi:predicted nucleotidyltransferase
VRCAPGGSAEAPGAGGSVGSSEQPVAVGRVGCHLSYMNSVGTILETGHDALRALCLRYRVRRLDLFGSAVADRFDPLRSDLDMLVEFVDLPPRLYADAYFELKQGLEDLFERDVDLVTPPTLETRISAARLKRTGKLFFLRRDQRGSGETPVGCAASDRSHSVSLRVAHRPAADPPWMKPRLCPHRHGRRRPAIHVLRGANNERRGWRGQAPP